MTTKTEAPDLPTPTVTRWYHCDGSHSWKNMGVNKFRDTPVNRLWRNDDLNDAYPITGAKENKLDSTFHATVMARAVVLPRFKGEYMSEWHDADIEDRGVSYV